MPVLDAASVDVNEERSENFWVDIWHNNLVACAFTHLRVNYRDLNSVTDKAAVSANSSPLRTNNKGYISISF